MQTIRVIDLVALLLVRQHDGLRQVHRLVQVNENNQEHSVTVAQKHSLYLNFLGHRVLQEHGLRGPVLQNLDKHVEQEMEQDHIVVLAVMVTVMEHNQQMKIVI